MYYNNQISCRIIFLLLLKKKKVIETNMTKW